MRMEVPSMRRHAKSTLRCRFRFRKFQQLVGHEVVPAHVSTFTYLQNLYVAESLDSKPPYRR